MLHQGSLPLSLIVITKNEERNIGRCLASAAWIKDIVVLDSGSTDQTAYIAQKNGARFFTGPWLGFGPQKQKAVDLAFNDWVLCLDADEALSEELSIEIQELFSSSQIDEFPAYRIPRLSFHLGRWIRHGGWHPDYQVKLFNRKEARYSDHKVHEQVMADRYGKLKNSVLHWVFMDLNHQVATNNRYSSLGAEELVLQSRLALIFKMLIKPPIKFIECYIWKRGFLDGLPGWIIAVGASYSIFLKFAKRWENLYVKAPAEKG